MKNILLITTDQQSFDMLSCAGNQYLNTPTMDLLAYDGIRFENAYVAQPLCIPQRCSWYTGLMPHEHGLTFNLRAEEKDIKADFMLGAIFRDAGYKTGYSGKWHINISPDNKDFHGFEWLSNIRCNGADQFISDDFKRFLKEIGNEPCLFSASYNNPHNICEAARGGPFHDGSPGMFENINQLPPLPDNFFPPQGEPSIIREVQNIYKNKNYPTANWDEIRWRIHRWFYCRIVEILDRQIGKLMDILLQSEKADNTIVVFTSDHGEGNAHHKWNQKQTLYDEVTKVPFIITKPGSKINRVEKEQLVNTGIDLFPTLCGLAEIDVPPSLKGINWADILENKIPKKRDHLIIETEFGTFGKPLGILGRAVRTSQFKYMIYSKGQNKEFLADMINEPGETQNLINKPEYNKYLQSHRQLLKNYIIESKDIFPISIIE